MPLGHGWYKSWEHTTYVCIYIIIYIYIYIYAHIYLNKDSPFQGLSNFPTDLPEDWPMAWSAWASASDPPTQRPRPQPVPRTHRGNLCAAASWCCCRAGRRIQGQNVGKKLYIVKMWGLNSSEPCWSQVLIPYIYIYVCIYIYIIIIIIYLQNIEDSWDGQWPCKSNWYTKSNWKHDRQRFSWPSLVLDLVVMGMSPFGCRTGLKMSNGWPILMVHNSASGGP